MNMKVNKPIISFIMINVVESYKIIESGKINISVNCLYIR